MYFIVYKCTENVQKAHTHRACHVICQLFFQGITLKMNDLNHCIVARIMHGGMIHRQGTDNDSLCGSLCSGFSMMDCRVSSARVLMYTCVYVSQGRCTWEMRFVR